MKERWRKTEREVKKGGKYFEHKIVLLTLTLHWMIPGPYPSIALKIK